MIFAKLFPLGYGAGSLGTALSGDSAVRHVAAYLEAGGNVFDTAHVYACWQPGGVGASERELGRVLKQLGTLESAFIVTKGGHPAFGTEYPRPEHFLAPEVLEKDITESCERLGVERIPLYLLHRDDGVTPVAELLEPLQDPRLGAIGVSNWSVERIMEANAVATERGWRGFVTNQIQGSLATPSWPITDDPTTRYLTERELDFGLPLMFYSATAGGYFAGKSSKLYDSPENATRRARAQQLAERYGATATQVALAWLRSLPLPTIPLFGTTSEAHLQELLGAVSLRLTPDEAQWLTEGGTSART
ncbi:aldo/keto reductase [Armatimonas rosea]|uniref:Aryl-alcohol dehydrogenase-like predicted oxidoreductase n=1 Tax=Armatimonas rosea TaxID=685828 RepID=A0A7W9SV29_ARMRO|nr:aldo/keto reductase [Armatimonas rosea]MBB6052885.1 aryl-alcohol dehydrogenase-like predicted oxidoreductase [Armatimonas rosea]